MVALKDFDHTKIETHAVLHVMPATYNKEIETNIFQEVLVKAWRHMRKIIPVEFRASVVETYQIHDEIMTVILIYKPLL